MEDHLVRNIIQRPKRHSNMNELYLSSRLHHGKQARLYKPEECNQNSQRLQTKSISSSSYTSLNSYLKEFNLSEKDFFELRQALKTIFYYLKPKIIDNDKQRLTSPYLQQQLHNDDQLLLPLYTNEYFIRNGLLNHNDGPEIYDQIFQSKNLYYSNHSKPFTYSKSYLPSSLNIPLPLAILSNQKYLFTALTSNFVSENSRRSCSDMKLNMFKHQRKVNNNYESETESMMIRRNKVKTWKRENILQQRTSITYSSIEHNDQTESSEYHSSSIIRTTSTNKDEKTIKGSEESIAENSSLLRTCNKDEGNDKLLYMKNTDDLFPMIKILAPYIIIGDSFHVNSNNNHSNCILSTNMDTTNHKKSVENTKLLIATSNKRSLNDGLHPTSVTVNHQSPLSSSKSTMNETFQTNNKEQVYQRKKNYLLAEFESVLTELSKQ